MSNAIFNVPEPKNEPVKSYAPGTTERLEVKTALKTLLSKKVEIPLYIGGQEIKTGNLGECRAPHAHGTLLGKYHKAKTKEVNAAIKAAATARQSWMNLPWQDRAAIFLKAADLLQGKYRPLLNAATMLGQSKTVFQAEIDSACELIDFFRFNVNYMRQIMAEQPISAPTMWNRLEWRPLEGFVFAVTPFNFTSIAGNLPTAPALMGNTVVWKPASSSVYSAYFLMALLQEAGLPDGVINMIPGSGAEVGDPVLKHPDLAGIHFTGSTEVFQNMWKMVGENIKSYRTYPRIVGETGGKDFVFAHESADARAIAVALVRGSFEYQGQKCSAASRAYIPESLWKDVKKHMVDMIDDIKMGDISDFRNFMGAVIDRASFDKLKGYIERAKKSKDAKIVAGGKCDDSVGYFVSPTVIECKNPKYETMANELFGPVLSVYVYDNKKLDAALDLCDTTSPYALTGAVFSNCRYAINKIAKRLRFAAGNFYINDKPTGAVVGQQPFGGSRASGTNDKAGSALNLMRWTSPRAIKETFVPPLDYKYPFMQEK